MQKFYNNFLKFFCFTLDKINFLWYNVDMIATRLNVTVNAQCRLCGECQKISFNADDWQRWQEGELIQAAMPYLSAGDREMLISETCDTCFDAMFPEEE